MVACRLQSIMINSYDKLALSLFIWTIINELYNADLNLGSNIRGFVDIVLGFSTYLVLRTSRINTLEKYLFGFIVPCLWFAVLIYASFEVTINFVNRNAIYFRLFFTNSGKAAVFVLLISLLNFSVLRRSVIKRPIKLVFIICALLSLALILLSKSRTSWLALILTTVFYAIHHGGLLKKKIYILLVVSATMLIILYIAFFYKLDSGLGRILIWKISLNNILEYITTGVGFDRFGSHYNAWQSEYFLNSFSSNTKEFYLADNTFYAFNEYIQFCIELGACPTLLFIVAFFRLLLKNKANLNTVQVLFLIATGSCCLTFYPLHVPFIRFLLIVVVASISNTIKPTASLFKSIRYVLVAPCLGLVLAVYISAIQFRATSSWQTARDNVGFNESFAGNQYRLASKYLSNEGQFMIEYAYFLASENKFQQSISVCKLSMDDRIYNSTYLLLGQCNEMLNNLSLAKEYYRWAIACIPSRLGPRYKLIMFYLKLNSNVEAIDEIQKLISIKLKNPDDELSIEIHEAAKKLATEIHNK